MWRVYTSNGADVSLCYTLHTVVPHIFWLRIRFVQATTIRTFWLENTESSVVLCLFRSFVRMITLSLDFFFCCCEYLFENNTLASILFKRVLSFHSSFFFLCLFRIKFSGIFLVALVTQPRIHSSFFEFQITNAFTSKSHQTNENANDGSKIHLKLLYQWLQGNSFRWNISNLVGKMQTS